MKPAEATLLLVHHSSLPDLRPEVVYLTPKESVHDFKPKSVALMVENQQNFLQFTAMLSITSLFLQRRLSLDEVDVVYGGGSHTHSTRTAGWLSQYDEIICAFDYDLAGLRVFRVLQKRLGTKAFFLQPSSWTPYQELFVCSPRSTERFLKAIELATRLGFHELAGVIHRSGYFMEQDRLLADPSVLGEAC